MGTKLRNGQTVDLNEKEVRQIEAQIRQACQNFTSDFHHLSYCCKNSPSITVWHVAAAYAEAGLLKNTPAKSGYVDVAFKPEVIAIVAAMTDEHIHGPVDPIKK